MSKTTTQIDYNEVEKFNNLAHEWWNPLGEFKTLHQINPTRIKYILQHCNLKNVNVVDVGCGGGILTEALAKEGAIATGIDVAPESIEVAKLHLFESQLTINYECIEISEFTTKNQNNFEVITALELLEHVPDPDYIIKHCASLLKQNGLLFLSTINRNLKSYLLGVVACEYILNIIPRGTHNYQKFITPFELMQMLKRNGLELIDIKGITYNPFTQMASLSANVDINYIVCCKKL